MNTEQEFKERYRWLAIYTAPDGSQVEDLWINSKNLRIAKSVASIGGVVQHGIIQIHLYEIRGDEKVRVASKILGERWRNHEVE